MAISRKKKEQLVADYVERLQGSEAIIVTDYRGLTVSDIQTLRGTIREAEGSYLVVKNTLARLALEQIGLPVIDDMLTGPIGIGFCAKNVPGVAKAVTDFAKKNDALEVKGGLMGDKVIDESAIKQLASLPSLDVLRSQLLGLLNTPATQLVGVVSGGVRQLASVINAYAEKEAEPVAAEA